mgnify:CR=1 FL=1
MTSRAQHSSDIPLPLALLFLAAVVGALFFGATLMAEDFPWQAVESFLNRNEALLLTSVVLLILNIGIILGGLQRWIGFRKQGSRLKTIRGERLFFHRVLFYRLGAGFLAAVFTYLCLDQFKIGVLK